MDLIKAQVADESERVAEVFLPLAAEADDDVGGERDTGHRGAQHGDGVAVEAGAVAARHALEDPVVPGLHGQVDFLADAGEVAHGFRQRLWSCSAGGRW